VKEPLAAVVFELPQREIGGMLPSWHDLRAQVASYERQARPCTWTVPAVGVHAVLRQARCTEIAALFDSVYVSFYRGLGGLAGCCLAGDENLVAQAREWRSRHGGTLFAMWPYAAAGLVGLRDRLPRMARYVAHARAIAGALDGVAGVQVRPDPPQTPMMHLHLRTDADSYRAAALRHVTEAKLWVGLRSAPSELAGWRRVELTDRRRDARLHPEQVRDIIASLVSPSP
jgi:threonine aldolase